MVSREFHNVHVQMRSLRCTLSSHIHVDAAFPFNRTLFPAMHRTYHCTYPEWNREFRTVE